METRRSLPPLGERIREATRGRLHKTTVELRSLLASQPFWPTFLVVQLLLLQTHLRNKIYGSVSALRSSRC